MNNMFALLILLISLIHIQDIKNDHLIGWKGIIPLHSSKEDVEKLFGLSNNGPLGSYKFEDATIHFTYSTGYCKNGWNVPQGTVLYISVILRKDRPLFSDYKVDKDKLEKKIDGELPDVFYYNDKLNGITYTVNLGELTGISYRPPEKFDNLKCK